MKIDFVKMQGAGNDFIILSNLDRTVPLSKDGIERLCDRRFGIGADGILVLESSADASFDARMIYYNADGSRGEMCGNGARCFTKFAMEQGLGRDNRLRFLTDAGEVSAIADGTEYTIWMTPPADFRMNQTIPVSAGTATVHYVNTGVPHVVRFVPDVGAVDVRAQGSELRRHPAFAPKGANVNFAQMDGQRPILVRTYERGVEDETLACGTGVTATAIVAHLVHGTPAPVSLRVAGKAVLTVGFRREGEAFHDVTLTGPAVSVFAGSIHL